MNTYELIRLPISRAMEMFQRRELSPVELTRAFLERIREADTRLNSYLTVMEATALEEARQAEAQWMRLKHDPPSPLMGIPLSLKDLFETQGVRTTAGSKFFVDYYPERDAFVVKKLKNAGAVILGKTNMHEIALGLTTVNPHFGACHNPWDVERIPGGSSGGSAAALAAGLCMGSLGTDTGGSIRVPAALCGIVGLKPTRGRVSLRGVIPLSWNLDHVGPMGRRVEDVAILLQVIAGYDAQDPYSCDRTQEDFLKSLKAGVKGWRLAIAEDNYFNQVDAEVFEAVRLAARVFKDLGAQVEPVSFPGAHQAALANGMMTVSDAAVFHQARLENHAQDFGEDVRQRLRVGATLPLAEYIQARRTQAEMHRQFNMFFENFDILLTPTTAIPAARIAEAEALTQAKILTRYTAPFNLTGLPAISLPCGFTAEGLPIGLQLVTASWGEARLLRAAYAFESATHFHERFPPV